MKSIPYSHQSINSNDIRQVTEALESGWITQGPKVKAFEALLEEKRAQAKQIADEGLFEELGGTGLNAERTEEIENIEED